MGLFDGIGGLVGSFFGPVGSAAGAAIGGMLGGEEQNKQNQSNYEAGLGFNSHEAQKNRDFQERMRSTQYQTAVGDMKAAGLNPMLAYSQGGAGTPSGGAASASGMPQIGNKAAAAIQAAQGAQTVENMKASEQNIEMDTAVKRSELYKNQAETTRIEAETGRTKNSAGQIEAETQKVAPQIEEIKERIKLIYNQTHTEYERQELTRAQTALTKIQQDVANGQIGLQEAQKRVANATATISEYEAPAAANEAAAEEGGYRKNVKRHVEDLTGIVNSITGGARMGRRK